MSAEKAGPFVQNLDTAVLCSPVFDSFARFGAGVHLDRTSHADFHSHRVVRSERRLCSGPAERNPLPSFLSGD
jgi:hypothetical protein